MTREKAFDLLGEKKGWTLPHVARRQAGRFGDRQFISFSNGGALSFAALHSDSDRIAIALAAPGAQRGDRVFAMMGNRAKFILLAIGCGRVGAIFVPVNTELKGFSLQHQLHNCAPRIVFMDGSHAAAFDDVAAPDQVPAAVVVIGGGSVPAAGWPRCASVARR